MDYVDWVAKVMEATARAWRGASASTKFLGIGLNEVVEALGVSADTQSEDLAGSKFAEALRDALRDLERIGLLEAESHRYYKLTSEGNKFPVAALPTSWRQIMQLYIDEEQRILLEEMAEVGQEKFDDWVCVRNLVGEELFRELGWAWDHDGIAKCYLLAKQLAEMGMLIESPRAGGYIELVPTYIGIVRVTREVEVELGSLVREMLADWETTNVDFKRELNLARDKEKAEFIRDVLALATTKSSGRRFLIVGFDDKSRAFHSSVDSGITQERLEQILHAYCEPVPRIKYSRLPWDGGTVGVLELFRDPADVPYRVKKDLGGVKGIHAGDVVVRHGSHTEAPTPRELEDLEREAAATNGYEI